MADDNKKKSSTDPCPDSSELLEHLDKSLIFYSKGPSGFASDKDDSEDDIEK